MVSISRAEGRPRQREARCHAPILLQGKGLSPAKGSRSVVCISTLQGSCVSQYMFQALLRPTTGLQVHLRVRCRSRNS